MNACSMAGVAAASGPAESSSAAIAADRIVVERMAIVLP